jgi:hypothetical protein
MKAPRLKSHHYLGGNPKTGSRLTSLPISSYFMTSSVETEEGSNFGTQLGSLQVNLSLLRVVRRELVYS